MNETHVARLFKACMHTLMGLSNVRRGRRHLAKASYKVSYVPGHEPSLLCVAAPAPNINVRPGSGIAELNTPRQVKQYAVCS